MQDSYTHITLVADRSGSMEVVRTDAQGAINHFLDEQKKVEGKATLTLVEFDARSGGGEDWYHVVHEGDLTKAEPYVLVPRGGTALLDAVGQTIARTGEYLGKLDEAERPSRVVFVIQTDGQENSSREWTWDKVSEAIKHQTETYDWQFIFLGMGSDSWDQGAKMGVSNIVRSAGSGIAHGHTHSVMNAYVGDYRSGHTHDMGAMRGMTVNAVGQVFNEAGEEVDSVTGKVKDTPKA